ncbi:transporter substrate-binding domain-containing protein [Acinetobacter lactucae]|uniref:transporter substrate-binding domain-containing protein n=1 Tax=Acinetobacter lactucae TaxID=1785128 RepID=UPI000B0E65BD|nr:transporter substrate-binding domain-containing protein [Acinetobacter lactucae]
MTQEPFMEKVNKLLIAPTGILRIAINLGNPVLARKDNQDNLSGVSVELAKLFAEYVSLPYILIPFNAAGKVFESLEENLWDLAFLADEPKRAEKITFSRPYVIIEGTYLVKQDSDFNTVSDLDRAGIKISVGKGAAYDLFLSRTLEHAELIRKDTSESAIDYFVEGNVDAAAGIRQPLFRTTNAHSDFRVLNDSFTQIKQAMAVPRDREYSAEIVDAFLVGQLESGQINRLFDLDGQSDICIPNVT